MMVASLLTDEEVTLDNCPQIEEISITSEICAAIGAHVRREGSRIVIQTPKIVSTKVAKMTRRQPNFDPGDCALAASFG